jgi:putative endonuclease
MDLERRIQEHNNGENRSTIAYVPFVLLYSEIVPDRISARQREKYLKSGIGKEFFEIPVLNAQVANLPAGRQDW